MNVDTSNNTSTPRIIVTIWQLMNRIAKDNLLPANCFSAEEYEVPDTVQPELITCLSTLHRQTVADYMPQVFPTFACCTLLLAFKGSDGFVGLVCNSLKKEILQDDYNEWYDLLIKIIDDNEVEVVHKFWLLLIYAPIFNEIKSPKSEDVFLSLIEKIFPKLEKDFEGLKDISSLLEPLRALVDFQKALSAG